MTSPAQPAARRRRLLIGWAAYLLLLGASHLIQGVRSQARERSEPAVEVPLTDDAGPVARRTMRVAYLHWSPTTPKHRRPPVILLHGSPGSASNFQRLARALADRGYEVYAPDLPGYGESTPVVPSYSILAHAYAVLECMNAWGIDRAHIVGWSQGGGVAIHLADLAPERTATLTLMASIGAQEAEGSGSYWFEHLKYAAGYAGLVIGGELVPHFGLLGPHDERRAAMRDFWDSDQRPLRAIMQKLDTPTLILQGDNDFLTAESGARLTHQLIRPSKLVILDASHFIPFLQAGQASSRMDDFFQRNTAAPGTTRPPFFRETIDLSPPPETLGARLDRAVRRTLPPVPWWAVLAAIALLALRRPEHAAGAAGFLIAMIWADAGVLCAGLLAGVAARAVLAARRPVEGPGAWETELARARFGLMLTTRLQPWSRRDDAIAAARSLRRLDAWALLGAAAGMGLWAALACIGAMASGAIVRANLGDSLPAMLLTLVGATLGARTLVFATTWTGRQRIRATIRRTHKHEFWPAWAYYAPLVPWLAWHGLRNGGIMSCTCVNPVIGAGGGVVGESKHEILDALRPLGDGVLRAVCLDGGDPDARLDKLRHAMQSGELPADYPIVLKPDAGQRGYAVRIARSDDDAREYLARMARPVVAQTYHPGPIELGVMWMRDPDAPPGRLGRVFSVTLKAFPDLVGDGRHTVEQLIYRHKRFRCQADMLLERFATRRLDVLAPGEKLRLTTVGNHSKGAIFHEADQHITPQLEAWIDRAAAAFHAPLPDGLTLPEGDNGLDFGRFDVRARSIEDVRAARGLAIIELNGTAAETTSIYDPDRPLWWSWAVLLRHWALLYRLGGRRRRMGVPPMGPIQLLRAWQEFDRDRPDIRVGA